MDLGIQSRVALVAAASRGLGKAVATIFAEEGARVAICSRSRERIEMARDEMVAATGAEVAAFACDVTKKDEVKAMIEAIASRFGDIDILVANAGGPPAGLVDDFTIEDYHHALDLNLISTIALSTAVLPMMRRHQWGRIIAITSIAARQPVANLILSNTARAGVLGYLKSLSQQVAAEGITVNSLCPGYTQTERIDELAQAFFESGAGSIQDFHSNVVAEVPMKRMGDPREFAAAAAFLASERAAYITGVALPIDGGATRSLY